MDMHFPRIGIRIALALVSGAVYLLFRTLMRRLLPIWSFKPAALEADALGVN